jgi:two-component sensor histidine kinase
MKNENIVKAYNKLMNSLCLEHLTIDTVYSQGTENWGVQEMLEELRYQLGRYYEWGTSQGELREDDPQAWRNETGKIKRMIKRLEGVV